MPEDADLCKPPAFEELDRLTHDEGLKHLVSVVLLFAADAHWQFLCAEEKWIWRRVSRDGAEARWSNPLADFVAARAEAMAHGFSPEQDHWLLEGSSSTTYYSPGKEPITIPK